jgi:subtilase family serine protease
MRGIAVFRAIGDRGSANQIDGQCHVSYPNCDPWTTACGGTIVGNITRGHFRCYSGLHPAAFNGRHTGIRTLTKD